MALGRVPYTVPALPPIERVLPLLRGIWQRGVVTNGGPVEERFEQALVERLQWPHTAVVGNGTAALQILLSAVGVGVDANRNEVVVSSFTHPATLQAVRSVGGIPVPADIEHGTLTADPDAVEQRVTARAAALLITHPLGFVADVDRLEHVARRRGIPLLFDAAAGVGVTWRGRSLGWCGTGSAFSFHATKPLCAVEAGAVASPYLRVIERSRRLRNFGIGEPNADPAGTNAKADELVSAVGLASLDHLQQELAARRRHVEMYSRLLDEPWALTPTQRAEATGNGAAAVVRLRTAGDQPLAGFVAESLALQGIESRRYFAGRYAVASRPKDGLTPLADRAREDVLCLPLWGAMPDSTIERVVEGVRQAVRDAERGAL